MDIIWQELSAGVPDGRQALSIALRLLTAMLLGGIVGSQREKVGKPAGLRTHMLVAMGAALFVLVPSRSGLDLDGLSRVIQGVATGIGFIGAGAILKRSDQGEIEGLTTAAGLWLTAAAGVAAGLGQLGTALFSIGLGWAALTLLAGTEKQFEKRTQQRQAKHDGGLSNRDE